MSYLITSCQPIQFFLLQRISMLYYFVLCILRVRYMETICYSNFLNNSTLFFISGNHDLNFVAEWILKGFHIPFIKNIVFLRNKNIASNSLVTMYYPYPFSFHYHHGEWVHILGFTLTRFTNTLSISYFQSILIGILRNSLIAFNKNQNTL